MKIQIKHNGIDYKCDLSKPLDISIPLGYVKCFHAPDVVMDPFQSEDFIGSVGSGSPVNFFNVSFNPHGNGTHTESLGHITLQRESINQCLEQYHFIAQVMTVELAKTEDEDFVILAEQIEQQISGHIPPALILRTLPNDDIKLVTDYSGTNPPYLSKAAMELIVQHGVEHLLVDLPSVDREEDGGLLTNHRLFWKVQLDTADEKSRHTSTITELVYVSSEIKDGLYLINMQIPSIELDAAPSKPVLYELLETTQQEKKL